MAFAQRDGDFHDGLHHLDESILAGLDEPRQQWDIEIRVRDPRNTYVWFSWLWGDPIARHWSIKLTYREFHRYVNAVSGPVQMQVPSRNVLCSLEQVAGTLHGASGRVKPGVFNDSGKKTVKKRLTYERPPKPPTIRNSFTRTLILDTILKLSGTIGVTQKTMTFDTHVCQSFEFEDIHPAS